MLDYSQQLTPLLYGLRNPPDLQRSSPQNSSSLIFGHVWSCRSFVIWNSFVAVIRRLYNIDASLLGHFLLVHIILLVRISLFKICLVDNVRSNFRLLLIDVFWVVSVSILPKTAQI